MVQHNTRDFVEKEIYPIIDDHFQKGTFPTELIPKFAEMGFLGINLPTEYGGGGMSNVTYGLAKKVDGGYILNGTKMWITNGSVADLAIVWAKTDDGIVRGFIVEKEMEGFSAPIMKNKWSLRASVTSELILDNVFVPDV